MWFRIHIDQLRFPLSIAVLAAVSIAAPGCRSLGARRLPVDQFAYNQVISRSVNEQLLLNVVRLRYNEPPVFLAANSILTQYVYSGSVGAQGSGGASLGEPLWSYACTPK